LAKIFGIYRFGIKNPNNGKNIRMDVLVMENLFYDHKCSKVKIIPKNIKEKYY